MTILRYGSEGGKVGELQKLLNNAGFPKGGKCLKVDSIWGDNTHNAMESFWASYGGS